MLGGGLLREAAGLLCLGLQPGDNMATKAIGGWTVGQLIKLYLLVVRSGVHNCCGWACSRVQNWQPTP